MFFVQFVLLDFVLSEIEISTTPKAGGETRKIAIANATAEIEQPMFPAAAIDGKTNTGWGIHAPDQPLNRDRAAVFHFAASPATASTNAAQGAATAATTPARRRPAGP
jgi:hypothetical protein